jgi:16S rRNA (adenine1518-N6/adenine1519-N6)-dimethyltransferase
MKNIKAKKRFGQNFLKDESILSKIIEAMPHNTNHIVEIGPGLGDLTQKMLKYKDVTAYEIDSDLLEILKSSFAQQIQSQHLELIHCDVLNVWKDKGTLYPSQYDLIANLPYYVATNIILKAIEDAHCEHIMVMIQKEVALKFAALCKQKEFCALSVITQVMSQEAKILFDVPKECFDPVPKVTSSILYIKKRFNQSIDKPFKSFLKVAFSQPRKTLYKNLSTAYDKTFLSTLYEQLDLKLTLRPHELETSLYRQMYEKVIINDRRKQE